jgi:hypothetical protein
MKRLRLGLSLGGFTAALFALSRDDRRIGWLAIGLLGASIGLRVAQAIIDRRASKHPGPADPTS